jgi:hypothetical protein
VCRSAIKLIVLILIRGVREVKKDERGGACSTNGGEKECIQDIGGKARRKETTGKTKTQVGGQLDGYGSG